MNIWLAIAIAVLETAMVAIYLIKTGFGSLTANKLEGRKTKIETDTEIENNMATCAIDNKKRKAFQIVLLGVILAGLVTAACFLAGSVSNWVNFIKLLTLLAIVAAAAAVDLKYSIIPNVLILFGLAFRAVFYIVEFFVFRDTFLPQLITDAIGTLLGFGVFLLAAIISRGAVGFGDVKLFAVIGLFSGAICTYSTMLSSLIASVAVSLILLICKKKKGKDSIPFGPFVWIGYLVTIILGNY